MMKTSMTEMDKMKTVKMKTAKMNMVMIKMD